MQDLPLFYAPNIAEDSILPEDEAGHAMRVLRMREGEELLVFDGLGTYWEASIEEIGKRVCRLSLGACHQWQKYWQGEITLAVAPPKSADRLEWLLEKAVEIGVDRLILLRVKHSERKSASVDRLERIILGAVKQSQKAVIPKLYVGLSLSEALDLTEQGLVLMAHCRGPEIGGIEPRQLPHLCYSSGEDVALFIGPEGDFTEEEVIYAQGRGAQGLTLGESRLRTETAGLVALQWLHTMQLERGEGTISPTACRKK